MRMVEIPYNYLNASMTNVELETYLSVAKSFRVKSCGFQITNIVPITNELGQVQNTTVTNTTFNTRPWMAAYVDSKYGLFQQRDFTSSVLPNKNFTKNIPATRAEGRLAQCVVWHLAFIGNIHRNMS